MDEFDCPVCDAHRPDEVHLDWCTYAGPDFYDQDEED